MAVPLSKPPVLPPSQKAQTIVLLATALPVRGQIPICQILHRHRRRAWAPLGQAPLPVLRHLAARAVPRRLALQRAKTPTPLNRRMPAIHPKPPRARAAPAAAMLSGLNRAPDGPLCFTCRDRGEALFPRRQGAGALLAAHAPLPAWIPLGVKRRLPPAAAAGTSPQRPPLHRPHNPAQPGQPGAPATGGPRISAVTAGRGQEISSERTSYIETHQADLERTSLQRDQTSKIPAPPGVGSRKGEPPASSAAGMRTPAGNSTPQANAAAPQTFAGERQTRRSQISNPGGPLYGVTGGTRQGGPPAPGMTGTVTRSGSGTPSGGTKTSGGTAGTHTAYRDKHTRSRSINTLADTAGIGTSPGQTTRPGHNAPIPGTAGTAPHRSHEQPLVGSAAPSSATAETRRSSGDRPPKARDSIPTFAMAETVPADGAKAPEVNRGTRRLKPGVSAPPFAGGKGKPPQSRKKRGEP